LNSFIFFRFTTFVSNAPLQMMAKHVASLDQIELFVPVSRSQMPMKTMVQDETICACEDPDVCTCTLFSMRQLQDDATCTCADPDICTCISHIQDASEDRATCICTDPDICTCSTCSISESSDETICSCGDPDVCACILSQDQTTLGEKLWKYQLTGVGRPLSQSTESGGSSIPEDASSEHSFLPDETICNCTNLRDTVRFPCQVGQEKEELGVKVSGHESCLLPSVATWLAHAPSQESKVAGEPFYLRPSIGTWLTPLPRAPVEGGLLSTRKERKAVRSSTPQHPQRWRVVDYVERICASNPVEGCAAGWVSAIVETVRGACRAHTCSSRGCSPQEPQRSPSSMFGSEAK